MTASSPTGPLDGVFVVALEQAVAAPYCSLRLADAGARVVKIERAEGDFARGYDRVVHGESAYFVWLNGGKESLVLDIKDADDAALLHRMVARADVFIQNLAPGAAARAGFGSADLRAAHPRLITCDISGYGETGPYRDMRAYDLLVQCESGLASITGAPQEPGRVGVSVCDISAGMYAYMGVLEALLERQRTGEGSAVAVSLFDSIADWMTVPLLFNDYGGAAPGRPGLHHPSIAPYGAYATGDGHEIVIAIQNEREWQRLCARVLGRPELADAAKFRDNMQRVKNRRDLDAEIAAVFGKHSRDELAAALKSAGIAFGRVNSVAEFSNHEQLRRRTVPTPSGPAQVVAPPVRRAGRQAEGPGEFGAVPALGQHSDALRREFSS